MHIKIYIPALVLAIFLSTSLLAQNTFKRNDLYLEAGGNGLFASVNYERQLTKQPGLGLRTGIGFYSEKSFLFNHTCRH